MALAIEASGLVKSYPGEVRALDDLSFEVEEGTVFGLLGPNGAGKSTAVKILTTLTASDDGDARVAGLDVRRTPPEVRLSIGAVQQRSTIDLRPPAGRTCGFRARSTVSVGASSTGASQSCSSASA